MTQYGFFFNSSRCTGCKTCELSCKDYKDLGPEILFRKVYNMEGGTWQSGPDGVWTTDSFLYNVSVSCNHCDLPACLAVCPASAIIKDEDTGLVGIDAESCISCGSCVTACPYEAPKLDEALGTARKCDGCIGRVTNEGRDPICVEACPLRALEFDDIEVLRSKYGDTAQIAPLPDPEMTQPNIVLISNPAADSPAAAEGFIANPLEIV
jgi:anaerobic dimethyl sulfoxide reductase subunit B (iron-sulfur subunit)